LPQLWLNKLFALIERFLLNFICRALVTFFQEESYLNIT